MEFNGRTAAGQRASLVKARNRAGKHQGQETSWLGRPPNPRCKRGSVAGIAPANRGFLFFMRN